MPDRTSYTSPRVSPTINLCETSSPWATVADLETVLAETCLEAGFPFCERIYAGSYFCENYLLGLSDAFYESVRTLCRQHDIGATIVVPIIGQAFLERAMKRLAEVLANYGDVFDEIVVNDVGMFIDLLHWVDGDDSSLASYSAKAFPHPKPRIGLGRLFSKERRDPRYPEIFGELGVPNLSAEAATCLTLQARENPDIRPLVEVDPTNAVVDVSALVSAAEQTASGATTPEPEVAIHLPFCYATTGRNCSVASIDEPDSKKFRLGRGCSHHCLRMRQGSLTEEGVQYVKHGRAYYFENPACQISGTDSWRIIYAASHETMR